MSARYALALEGLGRSFGTLAAVKGLTLALPRGERCAILGSNGAGKTTLFNLISGDLIPDRGRVVLDGHDVTRRPTAHRIRLGLRRTYQTAAAFPGLTVRECLFLAVRGVRGGRLTAWRRAAACREMDEVEHLAHRGRLGALLPAQAGALSHGALRQVEIAMAQAGEPGVLLLDEPAAGLSAIEWAELLAMLRAIPRDVTLLMIEHDVDLALAIADRVLFMRNGALIADGAPAEIAADRGVQDSYVGARTH